MILRTRKRIISGVAATLLLFAQAVAIAQACHAPEASPAMAFSEGMAGQDCHDAVSANAQPNPNACLQHCNAGDQTTSQAPIALPWLSAAAVLTVPLPAVTDLVLARAEACELHSPDPPRSLRFCSFQL
jgi:hypothetical protein